MTDSCRIALDHGVVGNGRVLALIGPDTHIDWLCMPRFDSASVFARILDVEKGGTFALLPDCSQVSTHMQYVTNTNVLRTEITCGEGRFDVYDYAPRVPAGLDVDAPVEIHRLVIPREGAARARVLFDPKPDYARCQLPKIVPISDGPQWAEALAMVGRLDDAVRLFHRLQSHANGVGLFSEDIEPRTGRLLGNFPQAYTHVGLINTAVTISELIDSRDARFRAWGR